MEENYSLNQQPQNPKQDHFTRIAFYKVGIVEILILGIILLLLFGILNYFNILPVSEMFPKYLSFLPRQQSEQRAIPNNQIITTPTPIYEPAPQYAIKDTKVLLSDVLNESLIPANLKFEKQNVENPHGYTFYGTGWKTSSGDTIVATVEYDQTKIIDRQIAIHIPLIQLAEELSLSKSSQLVSTYFNLDTQSPFRCALLPPINASKSIICEAFWEEENIRRGINIVSPVRGIQETKIFYCEHYEDTIAYSWKSCDLRYKDTGIAAATQSASL